MYWSEFAVPTWCQKLSSDQELRTFLSTAWRKPKACEAGGHRKREGKGLLHGLVSV